MKNPKLARKLILDELFDLSLYRRFRSMSGARLQKTLGELVVVEEGHFEFWQEFFGLKINKLNFRRRLKLEVVAAICRLGGEKAIHIVLEAIEIYGVKKYLALWELYKNEPMGGAVRKILLDELKHEDEIVAGLAERKINPERIRSIFLGFNDGLVEILGAVAGFFAALRDPAAVLIAGLTVAVAGSLSMAASAFAGSSSEKEMKEVERRKQVFLNQQPENAGNNRAAPLAALVGAFYFIGAIIPILPVALGSRNAVLSILVGAGMVVIVSSVLAFLSGMDAKKRVLMNLSIVALAAGITYLLGLAMRSVFGITI